MVALALVVAGLGCEGPPTDRERYQASLGRSHTEAREICSEIRASGLRGECLSHAAAQVAVKDLSAAIETCATIDDPVWADECVFLSADGAELVGRTAMDTCAKAGRFRERCTQHAAHRDLAHRAVELAVGEEARLERMAADVVAAYHPHLRPRDQRPLVHAAVAQMVAKRWGPEPFSVASCGQIEADVCAMAYGTHVFKAAEQGLLDTICAGPLEPEAVAAAGAVSWVADDPLAPELWAGACARERR